MGSRVPPQTEQSGAVVVTNALSVNGTKSKPSAAGATWDALALPAATLTLTGTTHVTTATGVNLVSLYGSTITDSSAVTVDLASTLYIGGPPAAGGSVTLTTPLALWVDSGVTRLDGNVLLGPNGFYDATNDRLGVGTISPSLDLVVSKSASGSDVVAQVINTSNTSGSRAYLYARSGGASGHDAFTAYSIGSVTDWSSGIDNSVTSPEADPYVLSRASALGTNDVARFSSDRVQWVLGAAAPGEGRYVRRAHVQTTNATPTTISTLAIGTSKIHCYRVVLAGLQSNSSNGAYYERLAGYKNNAGTVTLIGSAASPITAEDNAAWDITLTISGTNVLVQVTGAAATTIEWETIIEEVVTAQA